MLDADTKRRIDTARDILVGKVPDPKSQVEQITIALIYKFMDDMDAQSEELGGKRDFFAGGFARYGWAKLMRGGLGGHDTLNLYADAITRMPENPGIPPLFRDIFKNAYLPYRDPETLRAFLKIIDEFTYDHSERLGDAFEYLLSVLGAQGDAGQFRTPRHIIDFMVEVVDPKKDEKILDPACGTAGFLISAYKHILKANTDENGGSALTSEEQTRLAANLNGYDISPDMVRLSLANMYLHGFSDPHISEYDTLTSEDNWNEFADVILANPPFMSPKGGIRPHNRFSVQSKRSEVLFVDYMAGHLTTGGRAGIIVPEGIIFQSQNAYKQLRKMLVADYLVAVVSLPAGVFQPYSGVKTSVLILDKPLAKRADKIAFFKVENDGYDLGAQRREIEKNDLPQAKAEIAEYLRRLRVGESLDDFEPALGLIVEKEKITENGEYNLSGERYRESGALNTVYELVPVGRFLRSNVKSIDPRKTPDEIFELWSIPAYDAGKPELLRGSDIGSSKKVVYPDDILLSRIIPHIRRAWVVKENPGNRCQIASTEWIVFSSHEIIPEFLRRVLVSDPFHVRFMQTITGVGGSLSRANPSAVADIQIPLPPLDVQKEIVAEIEGYQKVIDGARAVVDNYRPHIVVDPEWPIYALSDMSELITKGTTPTSVGYGFVSSGVNFIKVESISNGGDLDSSKFAFISEQTHESLKRSQLMEGDVLFSIAGALGRSAVVPRSVLPANTNQALALIRLRTEIVDSKYVVHFLRSDVVGLHIEVIKVGVAQYNLSLKQVGELPVPLPPLETQQAIVAEIEAEQALVESNRKLMNRFEEKIQAVIARVWGEDA